MSEEIGSVLMDIEEELVMPDIPIKPNNGIPVAIGIILVLGSLLASLLAAGMIASYVMRDELLEMEGLAEADAASIEMLVDSGMALTFGILYTAMTLCLLVGGIMMMRRKPKGVHLSAFGGWLYVIGAIISPIWTYSVAADYGLQAAFGGQDLLNVMCGSFCIMLPIIAVMIPEGRAALYPPTIVLETHEEE